MWCVNTVSVTIAVKVFFTCFSLIQCIDQNKFDKDGSIIKKYRFADGFMFGVSASAYQTEGAWNEGGKGEHMWDTYLHEHPNLTVDHSNGDVATDSYHKYKEDIEMIKKLGVRYYRTSISWTRLQPKNTAPRPNAGWWIMLLEFLTGFVGCLIMFSFTVSRCILPNGTDDYINKEGVQHYRTYFQELLKANIVPIITLYHWDLPTIFMKFGGWCNVKVVDYFEDYARVVFQNFGDQVKYWMTINEIHHHCVASYGGDTNPPAISSPGVGVYLCFHNMLLAHARAYRLYEKDFRPSQKGIVGLSADANAVIPKDPHSVEDQKAAERYHQMNVGLITHPIFSRSGDYPKLVRKLVDNMSKSQGYSRSRLPYFTKEEIHMLRGSADFLGVNHYTTHLGSPSSKEDSWKIPSYEHDTGVKMESDPAWPVPGVSWLMVYPPGFRVILNWLKNNIGNNVPLIVMESGLSDHGQLEDYDRVSYYNEYLYQILLAIYEDGCNVIGYFPWTLTDCFEWAAGYTSKFGLYQVDFNSPNLTRTPKLSAKNYENIVRTRYIDFDYIKH